MASIREVAKRLNISITTVSRALDGYDDVAERTRQMVQGDPGRWATFPTRPPASCAASVPIPSGISCRPTVPKFSDPFSEFITGLGDKSTTCNFDLLISSAASNSIPERQRYEGWVNSRKVNGVVLSRMRLHDWHVQYLAGTDLPFVSMERSLDKSDHPSVEVDSQAGFKKLVAYLAGKGHRRIAYIGGQRELKIQADRLGGYKKALEAAGIAFDPKLVAEGDTTRQGGYQAAARLLALDPLPTAITCINDLTAIGVLHAASERGLKVGRDLAVAGFDGIAEIRIYFAASHHAQPTCL